MESLRQIFCAVPFDKINFLENTNADTSKFWKRFRRNPPAVASLWFIGLATFVAVFGYLLAPDDSPNADFQILELALRDPGFRAELLPVRLNISTEKTSFLKKIWSGEPPTAKLTPLEKWEMKNDSIVFLKISSLKIERISISQIENFDPKNPTIHRTFFLGTDKFGRCIFSRLILGFRVSLFVGLLAVAISLILGISLGMVGGYFGGRTDNFIMLLINTVWSIPTLLLVFAIVLAMGRGIGIIFLAVGLTMWVDVARVVRGQTMSLREMQFVEAARSMGFGSGRVLFRHILPNLLGPVMVLAAVNFATAILVESGLSFLGFGVQPPTPSWGGMLNENYGYALGGKPLLALAPAVAIVFSVLAFNLLGNGLRDALDVRN